MASRYEARFELQTNTIYWHVHTDIHDGSVSGSGTAPTGPGQTYQIRSSMYINSEGIQHWIPCRILRVNLK